MKAYKKDSEQKTDSIEVGGGRNVYNGDSYSHHVLRRNPATASAERREDSRYNLLKCKKSPNKLHNWNVIEQNSSITSESSKCAARGTKGTQCTYTFECSWCGMHIQSKESDYSVVIEHLHIMGNRMTETYQKAWNQFPNGHGNPGNTIAYDITVDRIDTEKLYTPPANTEFLKPPFVVDRPGEYHLEQILRRSDGTIQKNRFYTLDDKL
ncbi:MAG: hypothetical protein QXR73_02350 [Candidatus Micrarchaeaceae archaeon]